MSLDLLKKRFGHTVKKEKDNKEKIHETLNDKFNSNPIGDIKSFKDQHQEELKEKDIIIENLTRELGKQRLENKLALNTKKISTIIKMPNFKDVINSSSTCLEGV